MAQHDYNIANDSGANVRADLNNVLAAIKTMNSGATAPSATSAGMSWFDTSDANTWYWKLRNNSDDGWINVGALDVATDVFQPMIDDDLLTTYLTDNFYTEAEVDTLLTNNHNKGVSSTDNAIVRFNGTSGQVQNSGVYITDSGDVGIGTSSPSQGGITIDGSTVNYSQIHLASGSTNNSSRQGYIRCLDGGSAGSLDGTAFSGLQIGALRPDGGAGTNISFYTATSSVITERMRILSSGGITFNGDTSSANALDDYEEGTWSGVLKEGANTLVNLTGVYTKVGRLVNVIWRNNFTVSNNNNGLLTMTGLPYIVSYDALGSVQSRFASTTVGNFAVVAGENSYTLSFRQGGGYTHNLPMNNLLATNGTSSDYLYISCTYISN